MSIVAVKQQFGQRHTLLGWSQSGLLQPFDDLPVRASMIHIRHMAQKIMDLKGIAQFGPNRASQPRQLRSPVSPLSGYGKTLESRANNALAILGSL